MIRMKRFGSVLKMDCYNLFTNPMWIIMTSFYPFAIFLVLSLLTKQNYGTQITSFDYYGITMLLFGSLNAAVMAANTFMEKDIMQPNLRIGYAPISNVTIVLTKVVANTIFVGVLTLVIALGMHFFLNVNIGGIQGLIFLMIVTMFSSSLGIFVACLVKSEETANMLMSSLITLFAALGGAFYPLEGFGSIFKYLSNLSYTKWIQDAYFQMIYDQNMVTIFWIGIILIGLSILMNVLSLIVFRLEDYL